MKFSVAVVATTLAAVAFADPLQISNPTKGSVWTAGKEEFIVWSGKCANVTEGNSTDSTMKIGDLAEIQLGSGDPNALTYVAKLGDFNCTAATNGRIPIKVPEDLETKEYGIRIMTLPKPSYTNLFLINGKSAPAPPPPATTSTPVKEPSAASSVLAKSGAVAAAAVAAAAYLF